MARRQAKQAEQSSDAAALRGHWQEELSKSETRFQTFLGEGKNVVARYRLEDDRGNSRHRDKFNLLYSSTETIKPSLYTRSPKIEAVVRQKDRQNLKVTAATLLMEAATQYAMEEIDFDSAVKHAIDDFLLPGMGNCWVRYDPTFGSETDDKGEEYETLSAEGVAVDYVNWRNWRCGVAGVWAEVPWVARRLYFSKSKAVKRFGQEKADRLTYSYGGTEETTTGNSKVRGGNQAIVWEIWDKDSRKAHWYAEDYPDTMLDTVEDPLKLKDFFPCPQPMRAVFTSDTMIPKSYYSQYREQAEIIDSITARIRHLTAALRVIGVYDKSQGELQRLLDGDGNRMVGVENWAQFTGQGGINGAVQFVPIKDVAAVLLELYKQREIAKNEAYEITGFSDITRGSSKASETLGAQEIKNEWAGGRLRSIQTVVQNYVRDLIRLVSEVIVEHFSEENLAIYSGFEPAEPTPEELQAQQLYAQQALVGQVQGPPPMTAGQQQLQMFQEVVALVKNEKRRCALIGIETDSTIQPDEAKERTDRLEFLGQIGAFLQQAGPMALQYPDMRGLMGALMMFSVHSFRSSRTVEKEFEEFTRKLQEQPAQPPAGEGGETKGPSVEEQMQLEDKKHQGAMQIAQMNGQLQLQIAQGKEATTQQKQQQDHEYRMAELALKQEELSLKRAELEVKRQEVENKAREAQIEATVRTAEVAANADRADADQDHRHALEQDDAARQDEQFAAGREDKAEDRKVAERAAQAKSGASKKPGS